MGDLVLVGMLAPGGDMQAIWTTRDDCPYRGEPPLGFVAVRPEHIGDLTAQGFTLATGSQTPAGFEGDVRLAGRPRRRGGRGLRPAMPMLANAWRNLGAACG
jgi:hypothetical protein